MTPLKVCAQVAQYTIPTTQFTLFAQAMPQFAVRMAAIRPQNSAATPSELMTPFSVQQAILVVE